MRKYTKRLRLGIETVRDLRFITGGRRDIDISDVAGGCETKHCPPGPAGDTNS